MAHQANVLKKILQEIDRLTEEEQCELLEQLLLRQPSSFEANVKRIRQIRKKLPSRTEREVKRHADAAIAEVRNERY